MNWIVFHIASGDAFFTGVALLLIAAFTSTRSRPFFRRVTVLSFLVGAIAVVVSATPLPYWCYGLAIAATLAWIAAYFKRDWRRWATYAFVGAWLIAAGTELPYRFAPSLRAAPTRTMTILGDSVTAGMGDSDTSETWPSILAREHNLQIQDLSHPGANTASALKRAQSHSIDSPVVVVEIGGNDMLGVTTPQEFAAALDELLAYLSITDRQGILFELPLLPFYNEYGRAQRSIAAKHKVALIPKRVFLSVLYDNDATLDTIHLSQSGHLFMADTVWRILEPVFDPAGPN